MGMIVGWKSISKRSGFSIRTLKRWHYTQCRMPFDKTTPAPQGQVMIDEKDLLLWLRYKTNAEIRLHSLFRMTP